MPDDEGQKSAWWLIRWPCQQIRAEHVVHKLTMEIEDPKEKLQAAISSGLQKQAEIDRLTADLNTYRSQVALRQDLGCFNRRRDSGLTSDPHKQPAKKLPSLVIWHLGRLVNSGTGVDRIAGSTTRVHFILCAEKRFQQISGASETFPESVF
jgi:hypothetical protein